MVLRLTVLSALLSFVLLYILDRIKPKQRSIDRDT